MIQTGLFTSEAVSRGHPDKICDQISDAVLDEILSRAQDLSERRSVRAGVETLVAAQRVVVAGETTPRHLPSADDITRIVGDAVTACGYLPAWELGFDAECCTVQSMLTSQSEDIAGGVDREGAEDPNAGDQGLMFGYACDEVADVLMPAPIYYAHRLMHRHEELMGSGGRDALLRPDAKSQVTFRYQDGAPQAVDTVVVSTQHAVGRSREVRDYVYENLIQPVFAGAYAIDDATILINPSDKFEKGGPAADCGLTGRKIIVDTYGGMARHGGGAFSGKDPSKVDRSASYAARYVAKNIVAAGLARKCEVQLAYAIGVKEPVSVSLDTFGGCADEARLSAVIQEIFTLTPRGIIDMLHLLDDARPCYQEVAAHGHFGHTDTRQYPWENTDRTDQITAAFKG